MAPPPTCPSENALLRFAQGGGAEPELAWVEEHVDSCEPCRRSLAAAAVDDPGPAPRRLPRAGEIIGRYQVLEPLGAGGMGVVYRARDQTLGREVALKFVRDLWAGEPVERLRREAEAMARLAHPNLVPIYELGAWDGQLFLVMEHIDGPTLDRWLEAAPPLRERLRVLLAAADGLAAAHAAGVVHRDLKPANILVGRDGRPRVADFGLARPEPGSPHPDAAANSAPSPLTQAGALVGTLAYMAPEQLEGRLADARSDQFAWCVVVVEALTGSRPFAGTTRDDLARAMRGPPRLAGLPWSLRRALARGLAHDPGARFESMRPLARAAADSRQQAIMGGGALAILLVLAAALSWHVASRRLAPKLPTEPIPVRLHVGESRELDLPLQQLARLAVADPLKVRFAPVAPHGLSLEGLLAGETSIVAWDSEQRRVTLRVTVLAKGDP